MKLYSIRDWDTHFEVAQTRRVIQNLRWVPLPVKHDGKTFRRIMAMPNGISIYGAWVLIVQVAAKSTPRGVLRDEDGPLTAEDIAIKTGAPATVIQEALDALSSARIGWIVAVESEHTPSTLRATETPDNGAGHQPPTSSGAEDTGQVGAHSEHARSTVYLHDTTEHNTTRQDNTQHNNGALGAAPGVCVPDGPPKITREQLLAYAADPVLGDGITRPQAWATARLKDHAMDDEVRHWLAVNGDRKHDEKLPGNRGQDRANGRAAANRRTGAGRVKAPDSEV